MNAREKVEEALAQGKGLPATPDVVVRITELCGNPNATARDLGKVLQLDTALTTRILKQVNSAFYGLSASIKTVTHAVVILGFNETKNIALSVPVAGLYSEQANAPGISVPALWDKTLEIACFARALSYHIRYPVPEEVFVAGMLSNTGMVVLNSILGDDYAAVVAASPEEEFLPEVELSELGISHPEVCRLLAKKWRFPQELVDAVSRNYDPVFAGEVLMLAALIYTARRARQVLLAGGSQEAAIDRLSGEVAEALQLTPAAIGTAWAKARFEFDYARKMLAE